MQARGDRYQTVNTFTRKVQITQLLSYILVLSLLIVFCSCVQNNYESQSIRIAMMVIFFADLLVLVVSTYISSKCDPVDPVLLTYRNGNKQQIISIINDCLYCDTCQSYVMETSRHCKLCNRCVHHFDHHCGWINNCIGQENYKSFFVMIVSALIYMVIFCLSVGLLYQQAAWKTLKSAIIASWIFFSLALIFAVLLAVLVSLHIYLSLLGITTFQFIMQKRTQQQAKIDAQRTIENIPHIENNITTEEVIQRPHQQKAQEIVFERTGTEDGQATAFPARQETIKNQRQQLRKQFFKNKTKQVQSSTHDNSADLKDVFQKYKSLKYLVGNDVLVSSNHNPNNYEKSFHTVRMSRQNTDKNKKYQNMSVLSYISQKGHSR